MLTSASRQPQVAVARRLNVALFAPIVLLIAVGVVLALQVVRMTRDAEWLDHTHEVISKAHQAQKEISLQNAGFRGYLLTADSAFLEPFHEAKPVESLKELLRLVSDNNEQVARVEKARKTYEDWLVRVVPLSNEAGIAKAASAPEVRARKQQMDAIENALEELVVAENVLRRARSAAASASTDTTWLGFIILMLSTAAAISLLSRNQVKSIAAAYETTLERDASSREAVERERWIRDGQLRLAEHMQGDVPMRQHGERILRSLASYVDADIGVFFAAEPGAFRRQAGYGLASDAAIAESFAPGEGMVGRAAQSNEVVRIRDVPPKALSLSSGTALAEPAEIVLIPARVDGVVHAVVELAFLRPPDARTLELLERVRENIALSTRSIEHRARLRELLDESQRQGEELRTQEEELRVANEELQEQGNALQDAHWQLEERQRVLETINARLEEQAVALRRGEQDLTQKAEEVERASRYKSEFLAKMSHELRTPLNSSLILAKLLADNKEGNLTTEQVRFAETIYGAGNDLLALINDILDLSKIEAGRLDVHLAPVSVSGVGEGLARIFEPTASNKGLKFMVEVGPDVPTSLETDAQRLDQILRNLLSNAIKFTDDGVVSLRISARQESIAFEVADTGIGIAPSDQAIVFEAFRQADSSARRKYGGTGLGLSISRQLSTLLGGSLDVRSEVGKGSVFTLLLPIEPFPPSPVTAAPPPAPKRLESDKESAAEHRSDNARPAHPPLFDDDRAKLDRSRRLVLVVEDDVPFAKILCELARELDFQCLVAHDADGGIALAREFLPNAIVLDINLPDHTGLSVLDRVKRDSATRHIPVHVVSGADRAQEAMNMGAIGYLRKPVQRDDLVRVFRTFEQRLKREVRRLLIVEDDQRQREGLERLLSGAGAEIVAVGTVREALTALKETTFDCLVTDLSLPDASGFDLLERLGEGQISVFPPVVVYTGRSLTGEEEQRLRKHANSIIVKGARSPERLLDEVTLFLHRVESELPPEHQRMLRRARDREAVFEDRRILIVEDDVRNVFALSSALEPKGAKILIARNGREAIETLDKNADVDLVLMDIMMPEMDGITAMQQIRRDARWSKLPIIALTAKAMKDDQERCLEAGANDYIPKPLDVDMLLSLIRVWMPQ